MSKFSVRGEFATLPTCFGSRAFAKHVHLGVLPQRLRSGSFLRLVEVTCDSEQKLPVSPGPLHRSQACCFTYSGFIVLRNKRRSLRLLPATKPPGLLREGDSCQGMSARKLPVVSVRAGVQITRTHLHFNSNNNSCRPSFINSTSQPTLLERRYLSLGCTATPKAVQSSRSAQKQKCTALQPLQCSRFAQAQHLASPHVGFRKEGTLI